MSNEEAIKKLEKIASELTLYKIVDNINKDLFKKILETAQKKVDFWLQSCDHKMSEKDFIYIKDFLLEQNFPYIPLIVHLMMQIDFNELDPKEIFKGV